MHKMDGVKPGAAPILDLRIFFLQTDIEVPLFAFAERIFFSS